MRDMATRGVATRLVSEHTSHDFHMYMASCGSVSAYGIWNNTTVSVPGTWFSDLLPLYLVWIERGHLAGDGNARPSVAEPPDVFPHGDVAVPVGTHVVLVEAVVGEEGPDGDVVGGVEAHVHDPGDDAVVWPHGAGDGREGAEEHGKVALVGIVRGVDRGRCILVAETRRNENVIYTVYSRTLLYFTKLYQPLCIVNQIVLQFGHPRGPC